MKSNPQTKIVAHQNWTKNQIRKKDKKSDLSQPE